MYDIPDAEKPYEFVKTDNYESNMKDLCNCIESISTYVKKIVINNSKSMFGLDNYIEMDKNYKGLKFTKDTKKNEILFVIPLDPLTITEKVINKSELVKYIQKESIFDYQEDLNIYFYIWMLDEQHKFSKGRSEWARYLKVLPNSYDNLPIMYTKKTQKRLRGSDELLQNIKNKKKHYRQIYRKLEKHLKAYYSSDIDFSSFKKFTLAVNHVTTRIWSFKTLKSDIKVLIPLVDSFNTEANENVELIYDRKQESIVGKAKKDFNKNEEITVSYGEKSDYANLMIYGFVKINMQKLDKWQTHVKIHKKGTEVEKQRSELFPSMFDFGEKNIIKFKIEFNNQLNSRQMLRTFSQLRIINLESPSDISKAFNSNPLGPFSKENEVKTLKQIQKILQKKLNKYPQNLKTKLKDFQKIRKKMVNINQINSLLIQIKEKLFLLSLKKFSIDMIENFTLGVKHSELNKEVLDDFNDYKNYAEKFFDI